MGISLTKGHPAAKVILSSSGDQKSKVEQAQQGTLTSPVDTAPPWCSVPSTQHLAVRVVLPLSTLPITRQKSLSSPVAAGHLDGTRRYHQRILARAMGRVLLAFR